MKRNQYETLRRKMKESEVPPPPENLARKIKSQIPSGFEHKPLREKSKPILWNFWGFTWQLAAAVLALIGLSYLGYRAAVVESGFETREVAVPDVTAPRVRVAEAPSVAEPVDVGMPQSMDLRRDEAFSPERAVSPPPPPPPARTASPPLQQLAAAPAASDQATLKDGVDTPSAARKAKPETEVVGGVIGGVMGGIVTQTEGGVEGGSSPPPAVAAPAVAPAAAPPQPKSVAESRAVISNVERQRPSNVETIGAGSESDFREQTSAASTHATLFERFGRLGARSDEVLLEEAPSPFDRNRYRVRVVLPETEKAARVVFSGSEKSRTLLARSSRALLYELDRRTPAAARLVAVEWLRADGTSTEAAVARKFATSFEGSSVEHQIASLAAEADRATGDRERRRLRQEVERLVRDHPESAEGRALLVALGN